MKHLLIITLIMALFSLPAIAGVSPDFSVQGVLTNDAGVPLPDDEYLVVFKLYDAPTGGTLFLSEEGDVFQSDGAFNYTFYSVYPDMFDHDLWLELTPFDESPMTPRIRLTAVPVALRALSVDPDNAVTRLDGLRGDIDLIGGANVTLTQGTGSITISAEAGAGGSDNDWEIVGDDVYHTVGQVNIGISSGGDAMTQMPESRDGDNSKASLYESKLGVFGVNQGVYTVMQDSDNLEDGRHALFAHRFRTTANPGSGYGVFETNTAVTGYNDWGDNYTFGVAGYTWFDFNYTGGVIGSQNTGGLWGALAYRDGLDYNWGMYTPNDLHVGGVTETYSLRVANGASAGYILTSDVNGNASWQAPSSSQSDGDWTISGVDLFHSGNGTVAIGTSSPQPLVAGYGTTMQVSSPYMPTLCLDRTYGDFERWGFYNAGGGLRIGRTEVATDIPVSGLEIFDTKTEFLDQNGDVKIRMQAYDPMESGSIINMYGTTTTTPTLVLDGQIGIGGANILLRDGTGSTEVTITANHNQTGVGRVTTPVLEITGGSDLSEQFDIGNTSLLPEPGMVVSIDPDNPGMLTLCDQAYDRRVAGVISGAGGVNTGMLMGQSGSEADGEHPVALVGRVYVWADASSGPIEPGDLLTSSDLPGHAMKVEDHGQAMGAILGKAMSGLSEGQGLILTLVSLQ